MKRRDPLVLALLSGVVLLAALMVRSQLQGARYSPWPPRVAGHAGLPTIAGSSWARSGCLQPARAQASDWRAIPGVHKRVASELVAACAAQDCRAELPVIRGLGPVLRQRIRASTCRNVP